METTAAGSAAARGGVSLPISSSSQPSRKEWRVVSEQLVRNSANEELERSKLGQSDERLIYEVQHGRETVDGDFCSITIDRGLDNNILQQRLHAVAKQREELQHMEIELRGHVIARSKIVDMQSTFDAQIKEQVNTNVKLQEQLHERDQKIDELGRKMDETERELHAIRLDNEAAWAKEDLLREQSKELQSYRRERDNSEAERAQHIKQINDLQEHIQEKERQFMELQEQHRIAQETIIFKDEQLHEAQAWITRAQEMDALQSTTNHTLQVELRERTEQCNQLWLGCQRQFGDMERLHLHLQQLQLELGDVRERNGSYSDGLQVSQANSKDAMQLGQSNGRQLEVTINGSSGGNSGALENGNSESASSLASGGNSSIQTDHVHGVPFAPSSLLGMPTYLPTGQLTALHPFVIHQQGFPHTVQSQVTQSHFHSVPAISTIQNWQNQQALPDNQHVSAAQYQQTENNILETDSNYDYKASGNGQVLNANYLDNNISPELVPNSVIPSPDEEAQVLNSIGKSYDSAQSKQSLQQISSEFHDALRVDPLEHNNEIKEKINSEVSGPVIIASSSEAPTHAVNFSDTTNAALGTVLPDGVVTTGQKSNVVGKTGENFLLDERSLLASIVRTIGSGGRIRISSTLPNRLGKMLAPLHWHDYKKKYGKLDIFVASHPELFVIEGDHIQLREGAQEIIAATAAAAAAAAPSSYSSFLPSVTVTPMAQSHRLKKVSSLDSSSTNADKISLHEFATPTSRPSTIASNPSQFLVMQTQNLNGGSFHVAGGVSNVKILSKTKNNVEMNDSGSKPGQSVLLSGVGNGTYSEKNNFSENKGANGTYLEKNNFSENKGAPQGRLGASLVGKQQSRVIGSASSPRR